MVILPTLLVWVIRFWSITGNPRVNSRADYDAGVRFFKRILNIGIPVI